jgi:hypothetical protein
MLQNLLAYLSSKSPATKVVLVGIAVVWLLFLGALLTMPLTLSGYLVFLGILTAAGVIAVSFTLMLSDESNRRRY